MKDKEMIEEMAKDLKEIETDVGHILINETFSYVKEHKKYNPKKDFFNAHTKIFEELTAEEMFNKGYRKIDKDSVVLSREELKRLETNYKIGLGKSQSWRKSLKNRIEELEKENFKLKVENEVLKEEKEQFESDICNYEMNLQHLTGELEYKSKETAEKIIMDFFHELITYFKGRVITYDSFCKIAKKHNITIPRETFTSVEIKE